MLDDPAGPFAARVQAGTETRRGAVRTPTKAEALRGEKRSADAEAVLVQAAAAPPAGRAVGATSGAVGRAGRGRAMGRRGRDGGGAGAGAGRGRDAGAAGRSPARRDAPGCGRDERSQKSPLPEHGARVPDAFQRRRSFSWRTPRLPGDFAGARERLQAFLTAHPDHPEAAELNLDWDKSSCANTSPAGLPPTLPLESHGAAGLAGAAFDTGLRGTASAETTGSCTWDVDGQPGTESGRWPGGRGAGTSSLRGVQFSGGSHRLPQGMPRPRRASWRMPSSGCRSRRWP